jgi:hypothetical protein
MSRSSAIEGSEKEWVLGREPIFDYRRQRIDALLGQPGENQA